MFRPIHADFDATTLRDDRECSLGPVLRDALKFFETRIGSAHIKHMVGLCFERHSDLPLSRKVLAAYRERGFKFALDDLGAGYSSLQMIHELRPDFIKLDIELIKNVHADNYRATLTLKLIEAAQQLGIKTIAEGIECAGEYDWAQAHGADFVQGYYIGEPCSPPMLASIR